MPARDVVLGSLLATAAGRKMWGTPIAKKTNEQEQDHPKQASPGVDLQFIVHLGVACLSHGLTEDYCLVWSVLRTTKTPRASSPEPA